MTVVEVGMERAAAMALRPRRVLLWGLTPEQLHDRAWRMHGVQAVRRGSGQLVDPGRRYVLLDRAECVRPESSFHHAAGPDRAGWLRRRRRERPLNAEHRVSIAQSLGSTGEHRERVHLTTDGRVQRIERLYCEATRAMRSVRITADERVATAWAANGSHAKSARVSGGRFTADSIRERSAGIAGELLPGVLAELSSGESLPEGVREILPGVWAHESATVEPGARFVGRVWIGRDAIIRAGNAIVGPCIVPDGGSHGVLVRSDAARKPTGEPELPFGKWGGRTKRAFDIAASAAVLIATLPVSLLIVIAIYLQAGRPILFSNERQTTGGRQFRCLKFRTMRRDAERIKAAFSRDNTCDGPQFHIPNDPRTFPVGRVLRRCHLDELPQLINVLRGDMSIVGPRPSPDEENQCCPVWRHERLSVRAGITGLWQVKCRRRPGTDFQEWIRYDLEYVRGWSWAMDISIMCRTLVVAVRRGAGLLVPANAESDLRTPKASRFTPAGSVGVVEPKPESKPEMAMANAAA